MWPFLNHNDNCNNTNYASSDNVKYKGSPLVITSIQNNDTLTVCLQKIENTLYRSFNPTLQTVVNLGNTITLAANIAKGINVTLADQETIYQNGFVVNVPAQTGNPYPTYNSSPDAFLAKLNGQAPGYLPGFVGGFTALVKGEDNIAFYTEFDTTAGNSTGFFTKSFDSHSGDHFRSQKVISGVDTVIFKVDNPGNVYAKSFRLTSLNTAPTSATDTGVLGEIRYDANYMYVCVATNTWKRSPLTTW